MDQTRKNQLLLFGSAVTLGGASLWLRRYMMEFCFDEKGLLIAGNLPGKLLWAAGIAFALVLLAVLPRIGGNGVYADSFPASMMSGGLMLCGGALLLTAAPTLTGALPLSLPAGMEALTGYAAAAGMMVPGLCRMVGKKPAALFHGIVCLFYMLLLVNSYRLWSADSQLHGYAYQHLALVLLMLCSFHRTCCDAGIIQRKKLLFTALSAAFCATAALSGDHIPRVYLASALWALGCCCTPVVLPPDPEEDEPEKSEEAPAGEPEGSGEEA